MVRNGKDDYAIAFWAIEEQKEEVSRDDATSISTCWRTSKWKCGSPCGCFLNSLDKTIAKARLGFVVIGDLRQKLSKIKGVVVDFCCSIIDEGYPASMILIASAGVAIRMP